MSKNKMENYYTVEVYDNHDDFKKSVNCTEVLSFDFKKKTRVVEGLLETTMENGILTIKDGSERKEYGDLSAFKIKGDIHSLRYSEMNKRLSVLNTGKWSRFGFKTCIAPVQTRGKISVPEGLELIQVKTIGQALKEVL